MGVPQLNSCCCGCSLKTGTKIIGWLSLIESIIMVVFMALALVGIYYVEEHPEVIDESSQEIRAHIYGMKVITGFILTIFLLIGALSFVLLFGIYQGKANLVLYWVIAYLTFDIIVILAKLMELLFLYHINVIAGFLPFLLDFYFILVVYSYYREIRSVPANYA